MRYAVSGKYRNRCPGTRRPGTLICWFMTDRSRRRFIAKAARGCAAAMAAGCIVPGGANPFLQGTVDSLLETTGYSHLPEAAVSPGVKGPASGRVSRDSYNSGISAGREAMFYTRLNGNRVRCELCARRCEIGQGRRGFCRVRENRRGTLFSLVYGRPAGLQVDPVEMEPMYHMVPGHSNLCVFTASCNFRCRHCHNWHVSQRGPEEVASSEITPAGVVGEAVRRGCRSVSHSINEPTIFYEYMYDIAGLAKERGLMTLFHTNGYISPQPLRRLLPFMDGVTVDLKGFSPDFYHEVSSAEPGPVLESLRIIRQERVHLEIVNLVIPTLNDDRGHIEAMCSWIAENLGDDVPLHFNRFSPSYRLTGLPHTPVETLEDAAGIANGRGLKYVYIGNVAKHRNSSTWCPQCGTRLIHRTHVAVLDIDMVNGRCGGCGFRIAGIWDEQ